jgi:hypothetical protein
LVQQINKIVAFIRWRNAVCGNPIWVSDGYGIAHAFRRTLASVTYAQLVEKLESLGISEKEVNVRNKLSRGKFTAAFLLQSLSAIGTHELRF